MRATLVFVVALATLALGNTADQECVYRKKNGLDIHWANPESCGRFYRCSRGIKREIICPGEREYDANTGRCVEKGLGTCNQNAAVMDSALAATDEADICVGKADSTHLAKAGYCRNYYICQDDLSYLQICDAGSYFNSSLAACVPDTDDSCWQNTCIKQSAGFMFADVNNCLNFYICSSSEPVQQNCDDGAYWCSELNACAPDTNDDKCWGNYCRNRADGTLLADVEDKSIYYECQGKKTIVKTCGEGTFDASSLSCFVVETSTAADETSTAAAETSTSEDTGCAGEEIISTTTTTTTTCEPETTTVCAPAAVTCSGGYEQGEFVPIEDNCMNFYICSDGELYEYSCGAGNYFDNAQKVCAPDTNGQCPQCQSALRKKRSVAADCTCPGGYAQGDMISNDNDCSKFYICNDGQLVEESCKYGNLFDSCNKVCIPDSNHTCWPYNVCEGQANGTVLKDAHQCNGYLICENEVAVSQLCNSGEWFDSSLGYCMPDTNLNCLNPCENTTKIVFLPYLTDCKKFYFCNAGQAYIENCTTGYFNIEKSLCLENTVCSSNICEGQSDGTTFPIAGSEKNFTVCLNNVPTIRTCTLDKVFNATVGVCLSTPSSNCNQTVCVNNTSNAAYGTLNQTSDGFCICKDDEGYEYSCPTGYLFNESLGICYSNAPCDPEMCDGQPEYTVSANRNNTHSFCLCTNNVPVIVDCPDNGIFNPKLGTMGECVTYVASSPNCDEVTCLNDPDYSIFPAKNTTDGFCYCNNTVAEYRPCPDGAHFNTKKLVCLADCIADKCNSTGDTFADPASASSYCYCYNTTTVEKRNCSTDYYYNAVTGLCVKTPCDVTVCLNTTRDSDPFPAIDAPGSFCLCDGSNPVIYNCTAGSIFNGQICVKEIYTLCNVALCANASSTNVYPIPAINDTGAFCYCFGPESVEKFPCPTGTLYDTALEVCKTPAEISTCSCPGGYSKGQFVPNPNDCRKYFICSDGHLQEGDCGAGNFFDSSCNYCKPDLDHVCQQAANCTCVGGYAEGKMLPHPNNCQLFYICSAGQLHEMDCGTGNYFNSQVEVCEPTSRTARTFSAQAIDEEVSKFKGINNFLKKFSLL